MIESKETTRSGLSIEEAFLKLTEKKDGEAKEALELATFIFPDTYVAKHTMVRFNDKKGGVEASFIASKDNLNIHWGFSKKDAKGSGRTSWRINSKKASLSEVLSKLKEN